MEKIVGISYTSKNKSQFEKIKDKLNYLGIKFIDYCEEIKIKDSIYKFMKSMLNFDKILVLISRSYFYSNYCLYELSQIIKYKSKIIIIYLEKNLDIENLLAEAKNAIKNNTEVKPLWLENEFININLEKIIDELGLLMNEKYLLYDEIFTPKGICQLLDILKYTPEKYINTLEDIIKKDKYKEREFCFKEYLKYAPVNEIYNYYKAISYEKEGYIIGADYFLDQSIEYDPKYIASYIKKIDLAFKYPNLISINDNFIDNLESIPNVSDEDKFNINRAKGLFWFNKAKVSNDKFTRRNLLEESINCFKNSLKYGTENKETIYNNLGLVYELINDISNAANSYYTAIKISNNYYQAINNLALLYDKYLGEIELSKKLYETCLKIKPDYEYALNNYALLMEKIDIKKAMEIYFYILCKPHTRTDSISNLGLIFEEEKISTETAKTLYKIVLEKNPKSLPGKFNMGNFLRRNNAPYKEVMKYFSEVHSAMPQNDVVLLSLALLELREGNLQVSTRYCDDALTENPKYISAMFLKLYIEIITKFNYKDLIFQAIAFISNLEPNDVTPLIYNLISIFYLNDGNISKAHEWHNRAIKIDKIFDVKLNIDNPYYGMDYLEHKYTQEANGRIYKHRIENFNLDSQKQSILHLLNYINNNINE